MVTPCCWLALRYPNFSKWNSALLPSPGVTRFEIHCVLLCYHLKSFLVFQISPDFEIIPSIPSGSFVSLQPIPPSCAASEPQPCYLKLTVLVHRALVTISPRCLLSPVTGFSTPFLPRPHHHRPGSFQSICSLPGHIMTCHMAPFSYGILLCMAAHLTLSLQTIRLYNRVPQPQYY